MLNDTGWPLSRRSPLTWGQTPRGTARWSRDGLPCVHNLSPLGRKPSGSGFCDSCLAAGGGEQLADAGHRLFGCG
jgi:hypothetical protein